ncbi:MAG: hypothetical protein K9G60_00275 [Pseudolabrys sp.]|nr:hypothetical protein [Pseudolabrys sp.]
MSHDHDHDHGHHHDHAHDHDEPKDRLPRPAEIGGVVVIRPSSGLSGDMMLAGLARMAGIDGKELGSIAKSLGLPEDCVSLERRAVNQVFGWGCRVSLPESI